MHTIRISGDLHFFNVNIRRKSDRDISLINNARETHASM